MRRATELAAALLAATGFAACGATGGDQSLGGPIAADGGGAGADGAAQLSDGAASGDAGPACKADTLTDPLNCGLCGHDCLGGQCQDGMCTPVALASGIVVFGDQVFQFAVDDSYVYTTHQEGFYPGQGPNDAISYLVRVPKTGGKPERLASAPTPNTSWISSLALTATDIVYAEKDQSGTAILRLSKAGGAPAPISTADGAGVTLVALGGAGGADAFWMDMVPYMGVPSSQIQMIWGAPIVGGTPWPLAAPPGQFGNGNPMNFAADEAAVYVPTFAAGSNGWETSVTTLYRAAAGGALQTLWSESTTDDAGTESEFGEWIGATALDADSVFLVRGRDRKSVV